MLPGWTRVSIGGKAANLFDPPAALPFALVYLHSEQGDTPGTHLAFTEELRARRLRCVAPMAGPSWWVDRLCAEFDPALTAERLVLDQVLPWVETNWRTARGTIGITGIGMGGQGAVRLAFRHPDRLPAAASISGAFDFHERYGEGSPLDGMYPSREHCRQDTAILHVPPHDWPRIWLGASPGTRWYRGNDRLHEKLSALGAEHVAQLDSRQDDDAMIPAMLAFLIGELERGSRRLM